MSKSIKKNVKRVSYEDEIENLRRAAAHRHSKMNKYQHEQEEDYEFDEDFEYAEDVKHFLKK